VESRSRWDGLSGLDSALSKSAAGTGAAHCGADGSIAFCRAQSAREGAESYCRHSASFLVDVCVASRPDFVLATL
jgi:hypothetical protein